MSVSGHTNIKDLEGKGDVPGLVKALRSKEGVWIRSNAAEALGGLGDARAVEPLVAALESALASHDWQVADSTAQALGKLGDPRAVETLTSAGAADDEDVRESAREALLAVSVHAGAAGSVDESTDQEDNRPLRTEGSGRGKPSVVTSEDSSSPRTSWWGRRRKRAKVALVVRGGDRARGAGRRPDAACDQRPTASDAELVQMLMTTADAGDRHEAAVELAARHSLQATRDLAAAAVTDATARRRAHRAARWVHRLLCARQWNLRR